jgi:GDP-L-fucose synthase
MTELFSLAGKRIWVAGHNGMVGSALVRRLAHENCTVLTAARAEADLTRQEEVERWMKREHPHVVIVAAAKVGGILANDTHPADFLSRNLLIESHIIDTAHEIGVEKLLFLGSSCIYPRLAPQPIPEEALLTGPLEPTNEWYAIAKIAGIKLCQAYRRQHGDDFISAMPTNLYGPGDNFDLTSSHVLPALIRKADEARASGATEMVIWGSGTALREFMHVDDCADALIHLLKHYSGDGHLNVGTGEEVSIRELAGIVAETVGFTGEIVLDRTKPDGTPRKLMDSSKLRALGWEPGIDLRSGIATTYRWYKDSPPAILSRTATARDHS